MLREGHTHEEILGHYEDLDGDDLLAVEGFASAVQYQGSITLRELVDQARPCFIETMDYDLSLKHVCRSVHAYGPLNHHLTMRHGRFFHYVEPRTAPLSPDTPVFGRFLGLSWHGHDGFFRLHNYVSREEITDEVGGPAGICNGYTDCLAVLDSGQLQPYRTHYTDVKGRRRILDKRLHEPLTDDDWDFVFDTHRDVVIEWLGDQSDCARS